MKPGSFFAELKRRNVYKVAVAYAVIAWLLVQAASILFPTFEAPPWVMKVFVVIVAAGFVIALIIAWAFEMTPEGIKRTEDVPSDEKIPQWSRRKFAVLILVIAITAAALLGYQVFRSNPAAPSSPNNSELPPKSIAVLPFENLSDDNANAYFAEGIQDEILTRLAKIADLKVISRTSTQRFKSAPADLKEIAKQLGVANILEGSVQRISDAVHINVQLIRATTDEHLWAESYNRKLDDVFAVEGEVATAVAEQLKAQLTGREQKAITERPTQNTAAYEAYLRGVSLDLAFVSIPRLQQAAREYEEAVRIDPNFGIAWARLAIARASLRVLGSDPETNTATAAQQAADRAMALAPEAGETWLALGMFRGANGDLEGSLGAYQEAQKRMPNNSAIYLRLGFNQRLRGRWRDAEASFNKGLELDPRNVALLEAMVELYGYLRSYDKALNLADRAIAIAPELESTRAFKADLLRTAGKLAEADAELRRIPPDSTDRSVLESRVKQATYERDPEAATRIAALIWAFAPSQRNARERHLLIDCAYCLLDARRLDEARAMFRQIMEETAGDDLRLIAFACAGLGEKEKAIDAARREVSSWGDVVLWKADAEIRLAMIQARVGEKEAALAVLPPLLEAPGPLTIANLKFNPAWDALRHDPRFQKLLTMPEHVGP